MEEFLKRPFAQRLTVDVKPLVESLLMELTYIPYDYI